MNNVRSKEANVSHPSAPPAMQSRKPQLGNHDIPNGGAVIPTSSPESLFPDAQLPLPELCARIHEKIEEFLDEEFEEEGLKRVQRQTRTSLKVIEDALERYRLVHTLCYEQAAWSNDEWIVFPRYLSPIMAGKTV
jgi:hypothetical protein